MFLRKVCIAYLLMNCQLDPPKHGVLNQSWMAMTIYSSTFPFHSETETRVHQLFEPQMFQYQTTKNEEKLEACCRCRLCSCNLLFAERILVGSVVLVWPIDWTCHYFQSCELSLICWVGFCKHLDVWLLHVTLLHTKKYGDNPCKLFLLVISVMFMFRCVFFTLLTDICVFVVRTYPQSPFLLPHAIPFQMSQMKSGAFMGCLAFGFVVHMMATWIRCSWG